jgi:hypothetical protein
MRTCCVVQISSPLAGGDCPFGYGRSIDHAAPRVLLQAFFEQGFFQHQPGQLLDPRSADLGAASSRDQCAGGADSADCNHPR